MRNIMKNNAGDDNNIYDNINGMINNDVNYNINKDTNDITIHSQIGRASCRERV